MQGHYLSMCTTLKRSKERLVFPNEEGNVDDDEENVLEEPIIDEQNLEAPMISEQNTEVDPELPASSAPVLSGLWVPLWSLKGNL